MNYLPWYISLFFLSFQTFAKMDGIYCAQLFERSVENQFYDAFYLKYPENEFQLDPRHTEIKFFRDHAKYIKMGEYHGFEVINEGLSMGFVAIAKSNQTLRFDIEISGRSRGLKLYSYLLNKVLRLFPDVNSIPSIMPKFDSSNALFFFSEFEKSKFFKLIKNYEYKNLTNRELVKLREVIIGIFLKLPSTKARLRNNFGDIKSIFIDLSGNKIAFDVHKGRVNSFSDIKIYIKDPRRGFYNEVNASGNINYDIKFEDVFPRDYLQSPNAEIDHF